MLDSTETETLCTLLCMALTMRLWQVSLAGDSGSLIGHLSVTSSGAPDSGVANSLDGAYLGPFNLMARGSQCLGPLSVESERYSYTS